MKRIVVALLAAASFSLASPAFAGIDLFTDLPQGHWAYDAVRQLGARGLLVGYGDGSFNGEWQATRYEIATIVAYAMWQIDSGMAGGEDMELINKMADEFRDELKALNAGVEGMDERIAALGDGLGGWSLSGELQFDAKFSGNNGKRPLHLSKRLVGDNEFDMQYYRIMLKKRIDEKTTFVARVDAGYATNEGPQNMIWDQYYVTTELKYDIGFTAGLYPLNWESDLGFVRDNDPFYGNVTQNTLMLSKKWGLADLRVAAAEFYHGEWTTRYRYGVESDLLIAANLDARFNEKFGAGLLAYWLMEDTLTKPGGPSVVNPGESGADYGVDTYGAYASYKFNPNIELKALHYWQRQCAATAEAFSGFSRGDTGYDDSSAAWKVVLDIKQDATGIASIWMEYARIGNNFLYSDYTHPYGSYGADVLHNQPGIEHHWRPDTGDTEVMALFLDRWWWSGGLWHAFARYVRADFGLNGLDDAVNWTVGVGYRFNSGVMLELSYDRIDYGNDNPDGFLNGSDHVVQLRTQVAF
jgi:hypothetical protein